MSPRVFISSTIRDLSHVRHSIRDLILELGYNPVMSDFGDVGYLPDRSAADSCYLESRDCEIGILIIGKRYGDEHRDGVSVTHNEYRSLLGSKTPIITVAERDLLTFKSVFEANVGSACTFPGMDHPQKTFAFLSEVMASPVNNGVAEFTHIGEAREYVRKQIAHIFCSLLRERGDPMKAEIRDVLAEIVSLKKTLTKNQPDPTSNQFLRASRALLEDSANKYKSLLITIFRGLEPATMAILEHGTFDEMLQRKGWKLETISEVEKQDFERSGFVDEKGVIAFSQWVAEPPSIDETGRFSWAGYAVCKSKRLLLTEGVGDSFRAIHTKIRALSVD